MKIFLAVVMCLIGFNVAAQETVTASYSLNLTGAAPAGVTDGMTLKDVVGYRLTVCAVFGQTITSAPMKAWVFSPLLQLWTRSPTMDVTVAGNSIRCVTAPDVQVGYRLGRVYYQPNGVTVSGGTTVDVHTEGTQSRNY